MNCQPVFSDRRSRKSSKTSPQAQACRTPLSVRTPSTSKRHARTVAGRPSMRLSTGTGDNHGVRLIPSTAATLRSSSTVRLRSRTSSYRRCWSSVSGHRAFRGAQRTLCRIEPSLPVVGDRVQLEPLPWRRCHLELDRLLTSGSRRGSAPVGSCLGRVRNRDCHLVLSIRPRVRARLRSSSPTTCGGLPTMHVALPRRRRGRARARQARTGTRTRIRWASSTSRFE